MDAKLTDLKNQLQIIQSPPPAPGVITTPGASTPPQAGLTPGSTLGTQPPPGVSADRSYTDAVRDLQTGKTDLARNEFQQYLTYFPNTELAPKAQYYLGEIDYNRGDFTNAVKNFDLVLEHYPENPKTADAHLMKGLALLKSNRRNNAVQEFRVLVSSYPRYGSSAQSSTATSQPGRFVSYYPQQRPPLASPAAKRCLVNTV